MTRHHHHADGGGGAGPGPLADSSQDATMPAVRRVRPPARPEPTEWHLARRQQADAEHAAAVEAATHPGGQP